MNEDIRKNEIPEEELESAAGGFAAPKTCPKCGGIMLAHVNPVNGVMQFYLCSACSYRE